MVEPPCVTVCEAGVPESVKSGAALTVRLTVAVWVNPPPVAVIVSVYVPTGVPAVVLTVMVLEPDPVTEEGLKLALAPVGNPLAENVTALLNPFNAPMVAVYVVEPPWATV